MSLKEKVLSYIRTHNMLAPGQRVVAGLSGGADSVCLLSLLADLREEYSLELRAVHVHHGLRGEEADRDAAFSRELCRSLGVPFSLAFVNVKEEAGKRRISEEEAGRILRYQVFEREAGRWEQELRREKTAEPAGSQPESVKIAVAHHGDDSAETILYQLFRGSGLKGLSGIPPARGNIIRPLLCAERREIIAYLEEKGLPFVTDSTNLENDYARNKIRNQILPMAVQEINQGAADHIRRAGELIGEADRFFEERAERMLETLLETEALETGETKEQGSESAALSVSGLLAVVSIACMIKIKSAPIVSKRLSEKFGKLWVAAEVMLFVLVGAAVDIRYTMGAGAAAVLMIAIALGFRAVGVCLCLAGTKLNRRERLFGIIAYLPKATVQAAIGSVPLAAGLPCGQLVLSVAVLSILITAPLGAVGMDLTYRKFLEKEKEVS